MVEKSCYTCVQGDSEICIDIYLLKDVNKLKNKTLSLFLSHRVHYSKINITYLLEHVISNPNFCFRFLRKIYTGNLFIHFAGISLEVMTRISELACTFARKIDRFRGATWNGNESRIVERVSRFDTSLSFCKTTILVPSYGPCSPSFLFLLRFRNPPVLRGQNFTNRGIIELYLFTIRNAEIIVTLSAACEF